MHELGVVFRVIDIVKEVAAEHELSRVSKVTLELGEVSGVIEEYLHKCWKWSIKREPLMEEAALEVETIPAITECEDCGGMFGTVENGKTCPICGSKSTFLIQGNEFNIKDIQGQ